MGTRQCGSSLWARCKRRIGRLSVAIGALDLALETHGSTVGSHGFLVKALVFCR